MKKRGFGAGQWNGFGGKVHDDETTEEAAIREVKEEVGVTVNKLTKLGILDFAFQQDEKKLEVHIFRADQYSGVSNETEEMKPQWFKIDEIPYDQMWSADRSWLPLFLASQKFRGHILFDRPSDVSHSAVIIEQELKQVTNL